MADIDPNLKRYSDLDDVEIAEGEPDVRGWDLTAPDGRDLGDVKDLIVDTSVMKVRYLESELDHDAFGLEEDRTVLVPIESVQLDRDDEKVVFSRGSWQDLGSLPVFAGEFGDETFRSGEFRETSAAPPTRAGQAGGRVSRAEEELRVGKRQVQTGEVRVGKHVETEHVSQPVTRQREQVNVERRPVTGAPSNARIGEDQKEVRVPIVEEEVVVEKRPVVKEELVVNKEEVQETDNVEADLRKERFDVEREGRDTDRTIPPKRGER